MNCFALAAQDRIAWAQLGPDRTVLARTLVSSQQCPRIVLDGRPAPMQPRRPAPAGFPLLCEAALPAGTRTASIDGQPLPLPASKPARIVVIGDTGCRVRQEEIQDCDNEWKFQAIAAAAAARKPDLVIHSGDYVYRESPCPPGKPCQGPSGFEWKTWQADFFQPARNLLRAAPWIFVRGNHEECDKAGTGWFYLLDPRPFNPAACQSNYSEPYPVRAGDLDLVVLDSSIAEELDAKKRQVAEFVEQNRRIGAMGLRNAWMLTHQPLWGLRREAGDSKRSELDSVNDTLQRAWRESPVANVGLIVSGHIHMFQALSFADGRPPQVVVGNSGTELARRFGGPFQGRRIARTTIAEAGLVRQHGFAEFGRGAQGSWRLEMRNPQGAVQLACTVSGATLACPK